MAILSGVLSAKGRFAGLDDRIWDRLQAKLPAPEPRVGVTLVGIGDETLAALGGYPLARARHAEVLRRLYGAGARAIAIDVFFSGETRPGDDAALAKAIAETRAMVPLVAEREHRLGADGTLETVVAIDRPPEILTRQAAPAGFVNLPIEENPDSVYRKVRLKLANPGSGDLLLFGAALAGRLGARLGSLPAEPVRLDVRVLRSPGFLDTVEFSKILAGDPGSLARVAGRVALVAATAPSLRDIKETSLGPLPGAAIHAAVADDLLAGRLVAEAGRGVAGLLGAAAPLLGLRLAPSLWGPASILSAGALVVAAAASAATGLFLPVAGGLVGCLGLGLVALLQAVWPRREAEVVWPSEEELVAGMEIRLAQGEHREARLDFGRLPPELQASARVRVQKARALLPEGLEGPVAKVLSGSETWDLAPELRWILARELEEAGFLELALHQLTALYARDAGFPGVSDALFRLRAERDRRMGVLSGRALRDLLGREFRNLSTLGEGAEGLVLGAVERATGRPVAVKLVAPRALEDRQALARFRTEAEVLARVRAPELPEFVRVSRGRVPYLVMARVEGSPMDLRYAARPEELASDSDRILDSVVRALAALHAAGWVHRDVKPGNVLVPETGPAVLIDLGTAARSGSPAEAAGTPGHASPEQLSGALPDPAQDIYALSRLGLAPEPRRAALLQAAGAEDPAARPDLAEFLAVSGTPPG